MQIENGPQAVPTKNIEKAGQCQTIAIAPTGCLKARAISMLFHQGKKFDGVEAQVSATVALSFAAVDSLRFGVKKGGEIAQVKCQKPLTRNR